MNIAFYMEQKQRKREWLPVCGATKTVGLADQVVARCLSLRNLEIDVRDWVLQECKATTLPTAVRETLLSNADDEDRHKLVLDMAAGIHQRLISKEDMQTAHQLEQRWLSLPDHPITKAFVLETSVFFVVLPLLRFYGGVGLSMVAADISSDEAVHAAVNRQLSSDLGYSVSASANNLRRETVAWIVETLHCPEAGRKGRKETWLKMSDTLLENGVSDLVETKRSMMPAFFEIPNHALPKYT